MGKLRHNLHTCLGQRDESRKLNSSRVAKINSLTIQSESLKDQLKKTNDQLKKTNAQHHKSQKTCEEQLKNAERNAKRKDDELRHMNSVCERYRASQDILTRTTQKEFERDLKTVNLEEENARLKARINALTPETPSSTPPISRT